MAKRAKKTAGQKWGLRLTVAVNIILAIALLVSYLAPYVSPQKAWLPAILGLFYPLLFVLNLLFFVWWIIKWRIYFLISLLSLLLGFNIFLSHVAFNGEKPVGSYKGSLKVLSYNVRLFDQHMSGGKDLFTRNAIFDLVKSENAGVICFQEFFHGNDKYFPTLGPFIEFQDAKNYHVDYIKEVDGRKHYGLATFSKYPIVGKGDIHFSDARSNSGIFTDILFHGDTIRIYNFHLESVRFSRSDYKYVTEVIDPSAPAYSSSSRIILGKLRNAFGKRAAQAHVIAEHVSSSPYPVILCGDFNDTPASYAYHLISKPLKDAFLETGSGVGATYAGSIPLLRIDYILHSDQLEPFRFSRIPSSYSDHYPVSCYFKFR